MNQIDPAFASFLIWAGKSDKILKHFKDDTGIDLKKYAREQAIPINALLEKATGYNPVLQFHNWLIINYWGQSDD